MFKRLMNLVTPVFLVRLLDMSEYGEYRLFWLLANTAMLLAPLGMSRSLLYFIPRLDDQERNQFVSQTLVYLSVAGLLVALALSPWSPMVPESMQQGGSRGVVIASFVCLWVVASLIEVLPSADQRFGWQAGVIVGLSVFRNLLVIAVAAVTGSLEAIYAALLLFVVLKVGVMLFYAVGHYGKSFFIMDFSRITEQFRYALPFGLSAALTQARGKAEQWIVAMIFAPGAFGLFSIVLTVENALSLLRKSIGQVITPKMSRSESRGDIGRVLALNNRGNLAASVMVFPAVAYLLIFGGQVIELVYTADYLDAAPILRIYLIGVILSVVEVSTLLVIYKQGPFVLKVSGILVAFSVVASYLGATLIGLQGVAIGSLMALFISKLVNFHRASLLLDLPLGKIQNWRALGGVLLVSAGSSAFAWLVVRWIGSGTLWIDVVISALVLSATYVILLFVAGFGDLFLAMLGKRAWDTAD